MKKLLFAFFALTFTIACSKTEEQKPETTDQQTVTTQEAPKPVVSNRYGVKSGVIFYNAPMGTKQELYFDDYGAKEVSITSIDLGIAKTKSIDIRKDGFSYTYEEGKTEGTKKAWYAPASTDYSKADPKTLERYKVKDLGTEIIAGKDCKKFSAEFGNSPIVSWTWNNILIKSVTKMGGTDFVIEATKIQDGSVDSKIFELPAGVTFKEM
ncbi:MAG: hypothetical protein IPI19_14820 [Ignavibacteriales bacterium]|nr:hypothetical protein [Ignavibacteriales bacterium]